LFSRPCCKDFLISTPRILEVHTGLDHDVGLWADRDTNRKDITFSPLTLVLLPTGHRAPDLRQKDTFALYKVSTHYHLSLPGHRRTHCYSGNEHRRNLAAAMEDPEQLKRELLVAQRTGKANATHPA
jgi:hypothetical protein